MQVVCKETFSDTYRYNWTNSGKVIRVKTFKTASCQTKYQSQNLYPASLAEAGLVFLWGEREIGDYEFYIDGDYVEFGFGFNIKGGTTWAYSNVFWTMSDSDR